MDGLSAPQLCLEAAEDPTLPGGAARFLTAEDAGILTQFYLDFGREARRGRFGAAVFDQEIVDYCAEIEWEHSVLIARPGARGLEAVLEIHPLSQQWDCAELIAACPCADDAGHMFAQLLQIAAFDAGARGCRSFLVPSGDISREILPLLQGLGRVRIATTQACVDLGAYAMPRQRAGMAMPWSPSVGASCQVGAQFA